jgi:nitrogen-specific signal transduction histidine kinase
VLQTTVLLLAPQLEAEGNTVRLELAASLPAVLADSNQILHVCMHLAGQINARLQRETHSTLIVRSHSQGNLVLVDFSACEAALDDGLSGERASDERASQARSYSSPLNSEGENKPSTLALSACCRIVEEHGGRLLQPSTPGNPAFRMELRVAGNSAGRAALAASNWPAVRSSS